MQRGADRGGSAVRRMYGSQPEDRYHRSTPRPASRRKNVGALSAANRSTIQSCSVDPCRTATFGCTCSAAPRAAAQSVLVIGGIHGNEQASVSVARGLLDLLRTHPELTGGRTVAIIPNSNPDGYALQTRYNANKVDLNRNFPARNFPQKGTEPARGFRGGERRSASRRASRSKRRSSSSGRG